VLLTAIAAFLRGLDAGGRDARRRPSTIKGGRDVDVGMAGALVAPE
jgi:hypothetical protein